MLVWAPWYCFASTKGRNAQREGRKPTCASSSTGNCNEESEGLARPQILSWAKSFGLIGRPGARSVLARGTQAWENCSVFWRMRNVVVREQKICFLGACRGKLTHLSLGSSLTPPVRPGKRHERENVRTRPG